MRCWQCGVKPAAVVEVTTFGDPEPTYMATSWPPGDHEHGAAPPSPESLKRAADALLQERLRML